MGEQGTSDKRTEAAIFYTSESSKKKAYAKTAPMVHCLAFSVAGPIGEQGASDKSPKNGLCQNCTNGAL